MGRRCTHHSRLRGWLEAVLKPPLGPNLGVGRKIGDQIAPVRNAANCRAGQTIEMLEYSSGLNLAVVLTLNPIEGF